MRYKRFSILILFFALAFAQPTATYYQSQTVRLLALKPGASGQEHAIRDDHGLPFSVISLKGNDGLPYWYRRIFTPVCLTGECRPVDIGIYWHFSGKYLGIEIYREPLTKTDHSEFSPLDYDRLEHILRNEWSELREYTAEELVEPVDTVDTPGTVDAVTGATRKAISEAAVKDAVYTTHTIWHLIHVGEPEQLSLLALSEMSNHPEVAHRLLASGDIENRNFILRGIADGHLLADSVCEQAVLHGLNANDPTWRDLAFKALSQLNLSARDLQDRIPDIYLQMKAGEKVRLLMALESTDRVHPSLRRTLLNEFTEDAQPWIRIKILSLLQKVHASLTPEERVLIRNLDTDHIPLRKALDDFLRGQ